MRRCRLTCSLAFAALALPTGAMQAQADTIDQWISAYMKQRQVPGLALGILQGGRPVKLKGYGLANVEHDVPVDTTTVFQSASVAKQFIAAAVLLLAQEGKLALDDAITKYVKGTPASWGTVTIRHLLTNTSGIRDYEQDSAGLDFQRDYTDDEMLQYFARQPMNFRPGDDWAYSNTGYILLGVIIQAASGRHWSVVLHERIFEPLQMKTSRMISEAEIIPNRAAGYRVAAGALRNQEWVAPKWNTTADGSLYLTLSDLAKWDAALYSNRPLGDSLRKLLWEPVRLNDGTTASYGMGWFLLDEPGRKGVESDGAWQGFRSYIGRYLNDSVTVIILANSSSLDPMNVGHAIAALYRPSLAPAQRTRVQMPAAELDRYVGDYRLATGELLRVTRTADGLRVGGDIPLGDVVPFGQEVFAGARWGEARLTFVRGPGGEVQWLRLQRHTSSPVRARKVKPD